MRVICEKCDQEILAEDVNVAADTAYCRACGHLDKLSRRLGRRGGSLELDEDLAEVDTSDVPRGCFSQDDGRCQVVGVVRGTGLGTVVGFLAICLFWNGIVSVFVALALASTLSHMGVSAPEWMPAPEMDDEPITLGMTLFLWLFLTPFMVIGLVMATAVLMSLVGRIVVTFENDQGTIFQGVAGLGWRRRFMLEDVTGIAIGYSSWQVNGQHKPVVTIDTKGGGELSFGGLLTARRRAWLGAELHRVLADGSADTTRRRY